jgi:hypothetical protein
MAPHPNVSLLLQATIGYHKIVVSLLLQATTGGSAAHFKVSQLVDCTFKFFVASKEASLFVASLRSFSCDSYKLFFHLWGNGGPNWRSEFKAFQEEDASSWTLAGSRLPRKSFIAVVKETPPSGANIIPLEKPPTPACWSVFDRLNFPQSSSPSLARYGHLRSAVLNKSLTSSCTRCLSPKSKVNNRAKCLAISHVVRAKSYNSYLLFSYKKLFIIIWYHV